MQRIVSNEIKKHVHIPVTLTASTLSAVLAFLSVIFGIGALALPFGVACLFSVYVFLTLRSDIKDMEMQMKVYAYYESANKEQRQIEAS